MIPPFVAKKARLFPQQGNFHLKYAVPKRCPDASLIDLLARREEQRWDAVHKEQLVKGER